MTAPTNFEFGITLEALDVIGAGETFGFSAEPLTGAGPAVAADLARLLDPVFYPLSALIDDCYRLAAALGAEADQ